MMGEYSYDDLSENHSRVSTLATALLRVDPSFNRSVMRTPFHIHTCSYLCVLAFYQSLRILLLP